MLCWKLFSKKEDWKNSSNIQIIKKKQDAVMLSDVKKSSENIKNNG